MNWRTSWWNIDFHKRANLKKLPKELHLANDPWFTLKREHAYQIIHFINTNQEMVKTICSGGLANESLFAIVLHCLGANSSVIPAITHITDWSRMTSSTSPHVFTDANERDIQFIDDELGKNKYSMFIRKVATEFPNQIIRHYIYEQNKENDDKLVLKEPFIFMYFRFIKYFVFVQYAIPILFVVLFFTQINY